MPADNDTAAKRLDPLTITIAVVAAGLLALWFARGSDEPATDSWTGATPTPFETDVFEPMDADREIVVHCGNSMRPAAEALAAEFQRRHGIGVRFNFGGSSELLASIELARRGDLYLPHDPYAEILEEKGLLDHYKVVGYLEPIIIVPPGNPHNITAMRDLATPDLRIAHPDARYATAGKLVRDAFEEMGLLDELKANMAMEGRSHNDVALALLGGHVDVAVVWNFISTFYEDRLEAIAPPDVEFPEIRVTLCLLTHTQDREAAEKFMALATSEFGREVFRRHGYTTGARNR